MVRVGIPAIKGMKLIGYELGQSRVEIHPLKWGKNILFHPP